MSTTQAALTIEQIAQIAEVSRSTVSRVLNEHPSVRPEVRDRVLRVIKEYNYTPHAAARSLAGSRTDIIGLLIPRTAGVIFADPFFGCIIQSVTETCSSMGYYLMLSMITAEMEESFYNRTLRSRHFDGIILLSSDVDDPLLPLLIKDQMPFVLIGSHPYFQNLTTIDADNREGARAATAHLLELGHKRIGTITGPLQMDSAIARRDGYKRALLEAGIPIVPELIISSDYTQEGGYHAAQYLLRQTVRPTALFVGSDTMAMGVLRACHELGLRIPQDIALVGFDNLPTAQYANPPLTTVNQPITEMGATAVRVLIERIKNTRYDHRQLRLPTHLVVRESSGAVPAATAKGA
ncbi:MAG TPA: LacI family DNA-binding transcriptional regulator [Roseiflexaceae bacterium]|nr:LacI family DNA-binding transcriptional regulator [Roseiflexaceae bacterium]